jgi:hypothetical protein
MLSAIRNATHLAIKIRASSSASAEKPINLAILLDTSGSMAVDRLDAVKRTLHAARDLFKPADQITLVTFSGVATTITNHLHMDAAGLTQFYTAVDAIKADGCTNLSAGIEQLLPLRTAVPYDTILVLTDGIINGGVTSNIGLHTMMAGLGSVPNVTLGYGADHNRTLLRDLAVRSRGSYTYVDSDEILPIAMGDLIGGLRAELHRNVSIRMPVGWTCCELGDGLGSLVPDRDYWMVFQKMSDDAETTPIELISGATVIDTLDRVPISDCHDLQEQVLRCRVVKALISASDAMERGYPFPTVVNELVEEFRNLPEGIRSRPLILRMQAQLAEIVTAAPSTELLARMSSGGAYLSTQRGVTSVSSVGDPQEQIFSSPLQRATSTQVQSQYHA